jgi:tetratricopeptide (TPR) repeat protein
MASSEILRYVREPGGQPSGPFTAEEILEQLVRGELTENACCWCDGMEDWQRLAEVEPFAAAIGRAKSSWRGNRVRLQLLAVGLGLLVPACAIAWLTWREPPRIRDAKAFIAAGQYPQATETLGSYLDDRPNDDEAHYLLGIALTYAYACDSREADSGPAPAMESQFPPPLVFPVGDDHGRSDLQGLGSRQVDQAREELQRAAAADEKWREAAKRQLAGILGKVPAKAPDAVERMLAIANLQRQVRLAEETQLAGELLGKAKDLVPAEGLPLDRPPDQWGILARQILTWDCRRAEELLNLVLPAGKILPKPERSAFFPGRGIWLLDLFQQLASAKPALKAELSSALLKHADRQLQADSCECAEILLETALQINKQQVESRVCRQRKACVEKHLAGGKWQAAEALLALIEREHPGEGTWVSRMQRLCVTTRLEAIKRILDGGDFDGVVSVLDEDFDRVPGQSPEIKARGAKFYVAAARGLKQTNVAKARHAYDQAARLDPEWAHSEEDLYNQIVLLPQADSSRFQLIQEFLRQFPASPHRVELQMRLLDDATRLAASVFDRQQAGNYLDVGRDAAEELMRRQPKIPSLDVKVFALANRLASASRNHPALQRVRALEDARSLTASLLEAVPETRLRQAIEEQMRDWKEEQDRLRPPEPTIVTTVEQVAAEMGKLAKQQVVWIQLTADQLSDKAQMTQLKKWVAQGGVLWLDTDLARRDQAEDDGFGFRLFKTDDVRGTAIVSAQESARPIVYGLPPQVGYSLSASRVVVSEVPGRQGKLPQGMTLVLELADKRTTRSAVCALRTYGSGVVVYRPRQILPPRAGERFEANLRSWSFQRTASARP